MAEVVDAARSGCASPVVDRDRGLLGSLLQDSEDEADARAATSQAVAAALDAPTFRNVRRAFGATRLVGPDTDPLTNELSLLVTALVSDRDVAA